MSLMQELTLDIIDKLKMRSFSALYYAEKIL